MKYPCSVNLAYSAAGINFFQGPPSAEYTIGQTLHSGDAQQHESMESFSQHSGDEDPNCPLSQHV